MINVSEFKVQSFEVDHLDLTWQIDNTTDHLDRYQIEVQRSVDGPAGPWRRIALVSGRTTSLRDPDVEAFHNWRKYFYRLSITDQDTGEVFTTPEKSHEAEPDLVNLELRRRFQVIMQEFGGRRVLVFPILTTGFRCPACYGRGGTNGRRNSGRKTADNCPSCFDTTFVGGYATPIQSWMQIDPSAKAQVLTDTSVVTPQVTTARLSAFPTLKPGDMIVEGENIRWVVEQLSETQKGRASVHQTPVIHRITQSDVRYRVPVDLDTTEYFTPSREYTRPMSVGAQQDGPVGEPLSYFLDRLLGGP